MNKSKELAKNTFILFIGTFLTKVIQYFLLPVYTFYLSTSEYGTYELFNTLIYLAIPIAGLQIEQSTFRFLINHRNDIDKNKKVISSSFYFNLFINGIVLILFFLLGNLINNPYKNIFIVNLIIISFSSIFLQISRGIGDNKTYAIASFLISIFSILFNILFITVFKFQANGMMYGTAIGYLIGIVYIFLKLKLYKYISYTSIDYKMLKEMLKYSLPMIPNTISWWIFSSSDRFIISNFISLSATGILSVSYKFSNIIIVIYNVFNLSLTESISLHIDDDDIEEYYNNVFNTIGNFFVTLGMLLISCMPIIFKLLINDNYNDAYNLIPIAIISTNFQVLATMLGTIYVAKKNTNSVAITSLIAAIINLVTDIMLIRLIGIYAAVVSTVLSYLFLLIYRIFDIKRKFFTIKLRKDLIVNTMLNSFIICILFYANNAITNIISILLSICLAIIFNKSNILLLKKMLKKK